MNLQKADIQLLKTIQSLGEDRGSGCMPATIAKLVEACGEERQLLADRLDLLRENRFLYLDPKGLYVVTTKAMEKIGQATRKSGRP